MNTLAGLRSRRGTATRFALAGILAAGQVLGAAGPRAGAAAADAFTAGLTAIDTGDFGAVPYSTQGSRTIHFDATGTTAPVITAVSITGADAARFSVTADSCTGGPWAASPACSVTVGFDAGTWPAAAATLHLDGDATTAPVDVPLVATVGLPVTAASPADFGIAHAFQYLSMNITFTNVGTVPVTLGTPSLAAAGSSAFNAFGAGCSGVTLSPASTCYVQVAFYPPGMGPWTDTLSVPVVGAPDALGPVTVILKGQGDLGFAQRTLSARHGAAPSGTFNGGNALATTRTSTGSYRHAISVSRKAGTATVRDAGPYSPVLYTRSGNGGSTWTGGTRLNSTSQHGVWAGLAASGSYVYADWVRVSRVVSWSSRSARSIWFRRNGAHGSGAWATPKRLTSSTGRVDYPSIAATGRNVYIAYTDANTGTVRLLISHDRGSTWSNRSIGSTSLTSSAGGRTGLPSVAAYSGLVVVAWVSGSAGTVKARVSQNSGSTFGTTSTISNVNGSYPAAAAGPGRVGVATMGLEPQARIWRSGSWGDEFQVPGIDHVWLTQLYGPALVLPGTTGVGIAFSGCIQLCDVFRPGTVVEAYYAETPDEGVTWYGGTASPIATNAMAVWDGVSAIAFAGTRRDFLFRGWNPGTTSTRVFHVSMTYQVVPLAVPGVAGKGEVNAAELPRRLTRDPSGH